MMTIKNLGKGLSQTLIFLFSIPVFALTTATVNKNSFYPNDVINFTITASGNHVVFPPISQIDNHPILGTSSSQSINIINGKQTKKISKSYSFKPSKSLMIPAFNVDVDGNKEATQPIQIHLLKPSQNKAGDDFILTMKAEKKSFFIGDEIGLVLTLKQKKSVATNVNINIAPLEHNDLRLTTNQKFTQSQDTYYNIDTLNYRVKAKNFGLITIAPVKAVINDRVNNIFNGFFNTNHTNTKQQVYSNSIQLNIKPLPDNLTIVGDFKIKTRVDKTQLKQGEALNLTLKITGDGNLEDIEKYNLNMPKATIYSDEPTISNNQWQQKFAIIAQENFSVPSFHFDYFDKLTESKKRISSKDIDIEVEKKPFAKVANTHKEPLAKSHVEPSRANFHYYYLLLGILIGAALNPLINLFRSKAKTPKNQDLSRQIKACKNDKALFDLLLPLNLPSTEAILKKLEANLYKGEQHKINKKDIINAIQID